MLSNEVTVENGMVRRKVKDVIPSPKDTYNKIRNFDKIALQGFARRIGYPELSDLKKMDTSSIIAELISFLHGEKGDQFLENPNNFKDSKPTAKDKALKALDSLKRKVKDAWIDEYNGYKIVIKEFGLNTFEFTIQKNGKDVYKGVKETLLGARATAQRLIDQNKVSDSKTKDEQYPEVLYNGMYYQATYSRSDQIWNVCVYKTKKRMDNDIADHIAINVDKDKAIAEAKRKINSYGR